MKLERSLLVRCSVDRAFRTWTSRASLWWPPGHRLSGEEGSTIVFDGDRVFERAADGSEYEWGRTVVWEPPHRLVFDFFFGASGASGAGAEAPSRVAVTFQAEPPAGTRVSLVHEQGAMGDGSWDVKVEKFVRGWSAVLPCYERFLTP